MNEMISNAEKTRRKNSIVQNIREHKLLYGMMLPGILFFLLFHYAPMFGLVIAFKDFKFNDGIFGSPWVGFKYFQILFSSPDFYQIFWNTLVLSFYNLVFNFPGPIILALLLNELRKVHFKKTVQTIIYFPHFLSWVIVGGIVFKIFAHDGVVNDFLEMLGAERIMFLTSTKYFRSIFIASGMWKEIGWGTIIYLAALSGVDETLYEAAVMDGANKLKQVWYITLPSIATTIIVVLILRMGSILNIAFEHVFMLYNPSVYSVSDVFSTYIYRVGLRQGRFSYTTAIGLFQSVIGFVLVVFSNWLAKKADSDGAIW